MFAHSSKARKLFKRNRVLFPSVLFVLLIFAFSIALKPAASGETGGGIVFEKTVDSLFAKPGDRVNFTLSYLNNLGVTAYNVTVYDLLPSELTFAGSRPFYDGASDRETGFYRWSRGRVPPSANGTIVLSVLVNEVPVGTAITNTAHLAYEFGNGTRVEVASSAAVTVTQAAGVDVFPDQIHSVAPKTGAQTMYNITLKNTGNALDTFDVILRSIAYSPSSSTHDWKIELFNSTGYFRNSPVAVVYDYNSNNLSSWTDHGVVTTCTLAMGESTWFMLRVTEAEGTSGSGDALLDVQFIARSSFDPSVYNTVEETTIVRSVAGLTLAPNHSKEASPGDVVTFNHIIVNSGQSDVVDLSYVSSMGWNYTFFNTDGTLLVDSDGSGYVDVGLVPKNRYVYFLVKVTVPYSTPAGTIDFAAITARGVASGNSDMVNDTTTVRSAPMLVVSKRLVSENPGYKGDVVTYEVHIVNVGNTRLIKIPLDDTFETVYLDFSSAQPVEDSYDELAGNIHWENLGALEPGQSVTVTINFVATASGEAVRESSNVIDAEDEFGNLISATCTNADLNLVGAYTLTVTASPVEAVGGTFSVIWTDHGIANDAVFTTPKTIACDEGTTVTISYPESPIDAGDTRYVFVDYLPSASFSMDSDKIVTLSYRTEYVLKFDQAGSSEPVYIVVDGIHLSDALPQSFWVEKGSVVSFSYPSAVTDSVGTTRYVLTGISGGETDTSVNVNAPTVVMGLYKTQYYLSVTTDPEGLDNPQFSGWYDADVHAQLEVEALTGGDGTSTRFRFDHWAGEGITDTFDASTQILMDAPKTATACFVKQYFVTVVSLHDSPTLSQWVDEGASLTVSVMSPTETILGQTQWRCTGYSLDGQVQLGTTCLLENIQAPHTIEFNWIQQFWLQVDTSLADASVSGTGWYDVGALASISAVTPYQPSSTHRFVFVQWISTGSEEALIAEPGFFDTTVVMNSCYMVQANWQEQWYITVISPHDEPTSSQWVNATESLQVAVTSPADDDGAGTRYRCVGYRTDAGDLVEGSSYTFVSVEAAHSIEFEWVAQHYLAVRVSPSDVPETILGEGWYDEGTIVNLAASSTVPVSDAVRYRFDQWNIDTATFADNMVSISVDAPMTATAEFVKQFRLVVVSDHDTPEPCVGEYWYDAGTSVTASVTSPADESYGMRYRSLGWFGTGSVADSGYSVSTVFTMTAPSSIEWVWMRQYYLTVSTDPAGLDTPTGEGWYDEGTYASISVGTLTGGDMVTTRYRFDNWVGTGVVQASEASTTINVDAAKSVQAAFVKQFYLTLSTNLGEVTPGSGWYDVGSIVSIEAFAPTVVQGKGYVWHGWTGTGEGSYSGIGNPAEVTINGVIAETAAWKIDPVVTVVISNETIANGDRIVVYGETSPAQSGVAILVVYNSPSGSVIEHTVYTDDEGKFTDTLALDEDYLYPLFVENGEWSISTARLGDAVHEAGQASTALSVESQFVSQFPPIILAGVVMVFGLIAFVPPAIKKKNGNGWRRVVILLSIAGLILGAVSLALNWVVVMGTVTNNDVAYRVAVQLYPFSQGVVSISEGIGYVGPAVSSLVQMSSGPVLALLLIPVGCGLALMSFYKPKNARQRNLRTVVLVMAGVFFASSVTNTYLFVQGHASAIAGAGVGFGVGVYVAIVSCALTFVSALFATRENNEHANEKSVQLKMEEKPFFVESYPLKSEDCVRFRQIMIRPKIEPSEKGWCDLHDVSCSSCASWNVYYRKIIDSVGG